MTDTDSNRRPPFPARPWITGKLYDDYARSSILHCDAYVFAKYELPHLLIEWREGGRKLIARDGYVIGRDGLTPVWDLDAPGDGTRLYWEAYNAAWFAPLHVRVLAERERMLALGGGRWARVVTQCHYVRVRESDTEIERNGYTSPKPYAPRTSKTNS